MPGLAPSEENGPAWRARNQDYFSGLGIQARMVVEPPPALLRLPSPLDQLPWDIAQFKFGVQGADFIEVMGALVQRTAQSQMESGADWSGAGEARNAAGTSPT
jgi:hypothetical protein